LPVPDIVADESKLDKDTDTLIPDGTTALGLPRTVIGYGVCVVHAGCKS
jgi:hypothetical protein